MLGQYENARLSEANDLSTIMIVDRAAPPDFKYGPRRTRIVLVGIGSGLMFGLLWAFISETIRKDLRKRRYDDYED